MSQLISEKNSLDGWELWLQQCSKFKKLRQTSHVEIYTFPKLMFWGFFQITLPKAEPGVDHSPTKFSISEQQQQTTTAKNISKYWENKRSHWRIQEPPLSLMFFIFVQFLAKIRPNNRLAFLLWGWHPPTGKSWIRHRVALLDLVLMYRLLGKLILNPFPSCFTGNLKAFLAMYSILMDVKCRI